MNQASIGQQIRRIREGKDLSQENIAEELGITNGAYSKIESGKTNVSITRLIQIAEILKVEVVDFFTSTTPKSEPSMYGFATKGDVEELMRTIEKISKEVEILKAKIKM